MSTPTTDTRTPDDLFAALTQRFGEVQLAAFTNLGASRGVAVLDVVRAAVDDRLAEIVALPPTTGPTGGDLGEPAAGA